MPFRTPCYEGWESNIIWQLDDLFRANYGAPKVLDARQVLSRYPPVRIIYTTPRVPQSRDLIDWDSVRPALVRSAIHLTSLFPKDDLDRQIEREYLYPKLTSTLSFFLSI